MQSFVIILQVLITKIFVQMYINKCETKKMHLKILRMVIIISATLFNFFKFTNLNFRINVKKWPSHKIKGYYLILSKR